jgi:hypothetical protein
VTGVAEFLDDHLGLPVTHRVLWMSWRAGSVPPVRRWADNAALCRALWLRTLSLLYHVVIQPDRVLSVVHL